jgi:phosphatidylserine/phosphatidylglycerophosphate/cardiolipin synthase-like enzyme
MNYDVASPPPVADSVQTLGATIHFGGPDEPPAALRDLLMARVESAEPGSEIAWATYYLRDPELAEALVAAKRRGVRVRVVLEVSPRRSDANNEVIATLRAGLGDDLRLHRGWLPGMHLHAKIYTFSGGSQPEALIGSFNPTVSSEDDPSFVRKMGDQNRGENLLVNFQDESVVRALRKEVVRIWSGKAASPLNRFKNRSKRWPELTLFFYPRWRTGVVDRGIKRLGRGDTVRAAISHMDRGPFSDELVHAAQRGAKVEVVVDDARRRVPDDVVGQLQRAGVDVRRYCDSDRLPMHAKFLIVEAKDRRQAYFGSFNYNFGSRYMNQEVLARTTDSTLIARLEDRFQILSETADNRSCGAFGKVGA